MSPRRRLAPPLLALALAGCQGSDPQPLTLLSSDAFGGASSLVDGGGADATIGYTSSAASGLPTLRLARHDAASLDVVVPLGDVVFRDGGRASRLRVTDEAAALLVSGVAWVVDPADPALSAERLSLPDGVTDLAVSGRWVAAATDRALVLLDRDDPAGPASFATTSTPTGLTATRAGFLAFTTTGYLVVDTGVPGGSVTEVADPVLRDLREARPDADRGTAVAAGPGSAADRSRVLRLDLSTPATPVVLRSAEVAGRFVAFAWDGGDASVLAIHGAGDDARPESFHEGWLLRERAGGFEVSGLPLPFWSTSAQPLAARAGRLLAAQGGGAALLRLR